MPDTDQGVTQERLEGLQARIVELEEAAGRVSELETQLEQAQGSIQAAQERADQMATLALQQYVSSAIVRAEAYRDDNQRAHPKVFLQWLEDVLMTKPVGEGDEAITLETQDTDAILAYYRRAAVWLSQNMPGQVPMGEPQSERDTERPIGGDDTFTLSEDDIREIEDVLGIMPSADTSGLGGSG